MWKDGAGTMARVIECWKEGIKVIPTTKCNHFEEGETCGDRPNCFFKTKVARWQFLNAKKNPAGETEDVEGQYKEIDDAFF